MFSQHTLPPLTPPLEGLPPVSSPSNTQLAQSVNGEEFGGGGWVEEWVRFGREADAVRKKKDATWSVWLCVVLVLVGVVVEMWDWCG